MRRYIVQRDLLEENIRLVKKAAGSARLYGTVKADGYGLGLEAMVRTLSAQGIDRFAVSEPLDADRICGFGLPVTEILLMRPLREPETLDRLLTLPVTFSVGSTEDAQALTQAARRLHVFPQAHIQVDTGLGRFGFSAGEPEQIRRIYDQFQDIRFTGIYTHFACNTNRRLTMRQLHLFLETVQALERAGYDVGIRHCASSAALFYFPETRLDAVRIGSALLGRIWHGERFGLKRVGVCEASIDELRTLPAGATVGYAARFTAKQDMRIATICVGTLHGLSLEAGSGKKDFVSGLWALAGQARRLVRRSVSLCASVNGQTVPVLGVVCTEAVVLDVTGIDCRLGDLVRLPLNPLYLRYMDCVWTDSPAAGEEAEL
ncbi:MAG: alanine racemase [Oscillospiraceae bacterium]|nr:alanine racemase [Oscillospiraceae bacterium]